MKKSYFYTLSLKPINVFFDIIADMIFQGVFMRFFLLFILFTLTLFGESTFITKQEYASSLYKNPRGIGCGHCHGENGEGKVIANYIHKKKKRSFIGPQINNVDFRRFYAALTRSKKGMPRYYLTQREIEALYFYLHQNDKKEEKHAH